MNAIANASVNVVPSGAIIAQPDEALTDVLFEQLGYLIEFSHQERHRYERVKAILLEAFH
jgi:hypothetical protein